jgi:hypothetical protein
MRRREFQLVKYLRVLAKEWDFPLEAMEPFVRFGWG